MTETKLKPRYRHHDPQTVLEWIKAYKETHDGNAPSAREIEAGCAIPSTSTVNYILAGLEEGGQLTLSNASHWSQARAIQVVGGQWTYNGPSHLKTFQALVKSGRAKVHDYQAIFNWIVAYKKAQDGNSPTLREIGKALSISSISVVRYILIRLEQEGLIKWSTLVPSIHPRTRAIHIVGGRWRFTARPPKQA